MEEEEEEEDQERKEGDQEEEFHLQMSKWSKIKNLKNKINI